VTFPRVLGIEAAGVVARHATDPTARSIPDDPLRFRQEPGASRSKASRHTLSTSERLHGTRD
jgi:hypothetical protein